MKEENIPSLIVICHDLFLPRIYSELLVKNETELLVLLPICEYDPVIFFATISKWFKIACTILSEKKCEVIRGY